MNKINCSASKRRSNICCPLCMDQENSPLKTYDTLTKHLEVNHKVKVETEETEFSEADFKQWMQQDRREVNYTIRRKNKYADNCLIFYDCNRTYVGYDSKSSKRFPKSGGSIKISGTCPSRIIAKVFNHGNIKVKYVKTHVGHDEELRCQRLTKNEKDHVIAKLKSGVTKNRILEEARKVEGSRLKRVNLLTKTDLRNMERVLLKSRHSDDMTATAIKVLHVWNGSGQNFGFLFKQIGEKHFALRDEDFAVGFMNQVMEQKFKEFKNIICMDGTHNTNIRGWELTTILVKDDRGVGFPVAFLVSNRRDQFIYEIFFRALKEKIQIDFEPLYIMTDDDPKYYNAWVKTTHTHPQHLLCTWHVVKNWQIQGRAKLKNQHLKKTMKSEMRKILTETDVNKFKQLYSNYFNKLENENEIDFLNYLIKYYFQDENRIQMWAHCHRKHAGINTNMAIESLHKFIKYDELNRKRNNTIEKLLDILEKVVEDKNWKRIVDLERPSSNDYQQRIVRQSHNKAKEIENNVEEIEFGKFLVKSLSDNKFYTIIYGNRLCGSECRLMYCRLCEICLHKYICECSQYVIKSTTCKHVHMVALYERGKHELVLGQFNKSVVANDHNYCKNERDSLIDGEFESVTSHRKKEEINLLIEDQENRVNDPVDDATLKKIKIETLNHILNEMNMEDFKKFMQQTDENIKKLNTNNFCRKRVQQKQTFFPGYQKK